MRVYTAAWAFLALFAAPACAEPETKPPAITAGGETSVISRYVWRGLVFGHGAVAQSTLWVAAHGLTFGVWNNVALDRRDHRGRTDEIDYYLSTSHEWHGLTIAPSISHYAYPHDGGPSTSELEVTLSRDVGHLNLFLNNYADVGRYHGSNFVETGVRRIWNIRPTLPLTATVTVGAGSNAYHEAYAGVSHSGLSYAAAALSADFTVHKLVLRPTIQLSSLIGPTLRNSTSDATVVTAGLAVDWEF